MRGATVGDQVRPQSELISIHAPLAGCDIDDLIPYANNAKFQSTHPSRGATRAIWIPHSWRKYFNPRAPCGARQGDHLGGTPLRAISIHAPHAGRDRCRRSDRRGKYYFNPRAPCGARPRRLIRPTPRPTFQSTRPVRGATAAWLSLSLFCIQFQSTRPVRGATR